MKTIVIKNLSCVWDEVAVMIVHEYEAARRNAAYAPLCRETANRFGVDVKIKEDAADGRTVYTITDKEGKDDVL